jgi:hypothetical protein
MAKFRFVRPGQKRLGMLFLALLGLILTAVPGSAGAQNFEYYQTNYGYFSDDGDTGFMLIHIEPDEGWVASEIVSPVYAEDFLQTIGILDEYWWAEDLATSYRNQVDNADEYMVFEGDLNFYDGWEPGYVMLLSVDQEIFFLAGYRADSDDLFDLAEETIDEGIPPRNFEDYTRVDLDDEDLGSSNNNNNQGSNIGDVYCYEDRDFAGYDLDDDGIVTIDEFEDFDNDPAVRDVIDLLEDDGYDGVQYDDC